MSRNHRSQTDPGVFAVIHRAGGAWRVLVARQAGGSLEVVGTRRFGDADGGAIQAYLQGEKVARVISVVPSSSIVCRTCTLPDAAPAELEQALALQAETHLLGTAEPHRVATAVLEMAPGETSRTGIMVSWPEKAAAAVPPVTLPVTYAPDIAALAAILNGYRPADPLFWVDRTTGSVALALTHASGAVIRATREEGESGAEWAKNATGVLAETAISVGHSGAFAQSLVESHRPRVATLGEQGATLMVPREVVDAIARGVRGSGSTSDWWSEFGVAAGVAIAATGDLASLTVLEADRAVETPTRLTTIGRALAQPRTAFVTALASLVVIAMLPLAASGLRLAILRHRYPDIEERTRAIDRTESFLAMYAALEKQSWSMTKLLADVVSNAPQGIWLDSIRLQHSDETVFVSGRAVGHEGRTATEVIAQMQEIMRDSGLFGEIKLSWDEGTNMGQHEFELFAKVMQPHRRVKYDIDRDFARWSLAQRQDGEAPDEGQGDAPTDVRTGADETIIADATTDESATGEPATGARPRVESPTPRSAPPRRPTSDVPRVGVGDMAEDAADRSDLEDRGLRGPAPGAVPAPLTEAQIGAMTLDEASAALVEVAKAKNRLKRDDDPELFDRLTQEFKLLMARKREGQ